jgi:malonyl-CoA/methylmalonyl-CoA synthetase
MEMLNFPQDPILVRLLIASQRTSDPEPVIHDVMGFTKGYPDLLADILLTRARALQSLPESALTKQGLLNDSFPYVFFLTESGYEFLVAFFAIRALGGAAMPLGKSRLSRSAVRAVIMG